MNTSVGVLLSILAIAIIANLVVLNYTVFHLLPTRLNTGTSLLLVSPTPTTMPQSDECGTSCLRQIELGLKQVDQKIATLTGKVATPAAVIVKKVVATPAPSLKETFIPMGTGSTQKNDWEDIAGSDVFINSSLFPNISKVYFEVSMHIPTKNGVMYARLYNVTDKHPVWYSDVSTDQDTSTFVTSTFKLDEGNKQYRIQAKTSLEYQSQVDTARIKIISN